MTSLNAPKLYAIIDHDNEDFIIQTKREISTDSYLYAPLPSKGNHLRLIDLKPGTFDSPIHIEIEICELEFSIYRPDYYALSYTWNDPDHDNLIIKGRRVSSSDDIRTIYNIRHLIWCGSKRVLVSTNLRDALRRLRHPTEPVKLWIDQLCINQEDLNERATQVVTMQRIYHQARGVRIWLGEHKHDSPLGIQVALQLHLLRDRCHTGLLQYPQRSETHHAMNLGLPDLRDSPEWAAFMRLLTRPVFHRIWIVQEIVSALNAQVICGSSAMFDYQVFVDALDFLNRTGWMHDLEREYGEGQNHVSFFNAILNIKLLWLQNPTVSLREQQRLYLVKATRRFQATDPRDKIYALLPIINDYGHRDLHGRDAPIEFKSSMDPRRRTGPLDRMLEDLMKFEDEEEAVDIITRSSDPRLKDLQRTLVDLLRAAPKLLEPFLYPSRNVNFKILSDEMAGTFDPLARSLYQFQIHRPDTREHKQIAVFLDNFYKDILSRLKTFRDLLPVINYEPLISLVASDPSYTEDIERLQKRTNKIMVRLESTPDTKQAANQPEKESIRKLMADGKIIVSEPAGGHQVDEPQFHDWAWSACGSTVADYRKWTTAVYTEFTVKCLLDDKNLDIFASVEDPGERKQCGLPTWVPDFSVPMVRNPLKGTLRKGGEEIVNYYTSGDTKADISWDPDNPGLLHLEGHELGKIQRLASPESATAETIDFQHTVEWEHAIFELPDIYPTGEKTFDAYWRTLIGDVVSQDGPPTIPAPRIYGSYYRCFVTLLELEREAKMGGRSRIKEFMGKRSLDDRDVSIMLQKHYRFIEEMAGLMLQRKFCVLEGRLIGAVPISTQIGDRIFILKGGSVPYVMRDVGYGWHKLIGECYVHGVMRGERSPHLEWQSIELV